MRLPSRILVLVAMFFCWCCASWAQVQPVQSYALNPYNAYLDGQWEGIRYASDGNVYFASSSQSAHHGASFFKYSPTTGQLTLLAADITTICGENPNTNPQGKIHSDIVEANGWLYFSTHFASDLPGAYATWTGSHVIGYQLATGAFRDYGVIDPNYDSYSAVGVDPVRNYVYVFLTGQAPGQVSYIFRIDTVTGAKVNLGQVGGPAACLWMFVDQRGDVWFSPQYANGILYRVHGDTGKIDSYPNELPQVYLWNVNQVNSDAGVQAGRYIQWMQPLDGNRAVFALAPDGGMLYMFDSSKPIGSGQEFTNIQFIGYNYIGMAVGNNRVFWYQRANDGYGHQGDDAPAGTPVEDFHLMSVSLDPTTGYAITDHGLIQDQSGRLVWRVPAMMTDGHARVFMTGDWWTIPGDVGTLRYEYTNGVESYVPLNRGEFFAVASHVIQDTLTIQSTPAAGAPITGTISQSTNSSIQLDDGTPVNLTAPSTFTSGSTTYSFDHWLLNGIAQVGNTVSFTLNANSSAIAIYDYLNTSNVTISPQNGALYQGQKQQFTSTVQNVSNQPVTWSMSPNVGTLSSTGLYTAPAAIATAQAVVVTVTSVANTSQYAAATIILEPPVSVSIGPTGATLERYQPQQFTATLQNSTNQSVTWTIDQGIGSISSTGIYFPPATIATQQTVTVRATSVTDPSKSATAVVVLVPGTDHYVATNGTPTGDGSSGNPWDLQTALNQPASVHPGDIIWVRGGTYKGIFTSVLSGTSTSPIIVRNFSGQRATLDGSGCGGVVLGVYGANTWYWGLEVIDSTDNRISPLAPCPAFGVGVYGGPGDKFINMIVHDTGEGFSAYNASPNSEFHGNLSYYNGFVGTTRNEGHGMYLQNSTGTKVVANNFVGDNADEGIQIYGSGTATIVGFNLTGNTLYNTGSWPTPNYQYNLIIAGGAVRQNIQVQNNYSYFPPAPPGGAFSVGQYTIGQDATVQNNVIVGGSAGITMDGQSGPVMFTGNVVYTDPSAAQMVGIGLFSGQTLASYAWNNNTYYGANIFSTAYYDGVNFSGTINSTFANWKTATGFDSNSTYTPNAPTGAWTYIQPNKYEAKRANITIYNWNKSSVVPVDLSGVLTPGDQFLVQDAQNFYGSPIAGGTYTGSLVNIPMVGLTKATPIGFNAPAHTAPQFGTFIVMTAASVPPVWVSPVLVSLGPGQTQPFTATVLSSLGQPVNWSLNPNIGSISTVGVYTAPSTIAATQTVILTATSTADSSKSGSATINLIGGAFASFIGSDTTTQGNWQQKYGFDGYSVPNSASSIPSYATFATQNATPYTWPGSPDARALLVPGSTTQRIASAWYSSPSFTFDINVTDGSLRQFALYGLDWDGKGRVEIVRVFDATTNALLDTRSLSSFNAGTYLVWNIAGHVRITVTASVGPNAVISGVFFGGAASSPPPVSPSLGITKTHTGNFTQGQLNASYSVTVSNAAGAGLTSGGVTVTEAVPSGITLVSMAGTGWTCPANGNSCTRSDTLNAGSSYPPITVTVNVLANATSPQVNQVTVAGGGSAGASASDSTTITAVSSGGPSVLYVGADTATQGSWLGKYGADGYALANSVQSLPTYDAAFAVQGGTPYTWVASTTDSRALQVPGSSSGIASAWYNGSSFSFDVNMGASTHQFALYALDWDRKGRSETIQIVDANNPGTALDVTRTVSGFGNGVYLVWNITGHVKIVVTFTGGTNAVISGTFFGGATSSSPPANPALSITKTHTGNFTQSQQNAAYTVTVSNAANAGPTSGTVTVAETVPSGITLVSMAGTGWTCPANGNSCTRSDALNAGLSYQPITVTVNVLANATSPQVNQVSVAGGGSATANTTDSTTITAAIVGGGPTASFLAKDTATQGNWQGKYGGDGYALATVTPQNIPGYGLFTVANQSNYTWAASTSDPRALLQPGSTSQRLAATWFNGTTFNMNVNLAGQHQFALYAMDWDNAGRSETIKIVDAGNPGNVLDTETISGFSGGVYLVWNISGNVTITITPNSSNAVVSGIFFGTGNSNPNPILNVTKTHTGNFTQGQQGAAYAVTVSNSGNAATSGTVTATESVPAGLTLVSMAGTGWTCPANGNSCTRSDALNAGLSYQPITVTVNVLANATSPQVNQVSVTGGGSANANASDSTTINVANSGAATAQFVKKDTITRGNWQGVYGVGGYSLANVASPLIPSYAAFTPQNQSNYTWAASTSDTRAPLLPGSTSQRIAATWYNASSFSFDINFTDGNLHQVALYALDWDSGGRSESIQISDATTGAPLNTQSLTGFTGGVYLVWNISGHVKVVVNSTGSGNSVVSAVFFDSPNP